MELNNTSLNRPLGKLLFWSFLLGLVCYTVTENPTALSQATCNYIVYDTVCFVYIFLLITSAFFCPIRGNRNDFVDVLVAFGPGVIVYFLTLLLMIGQPFKFYEINFWACLLCWILVFNFYNYVKSIGSKIDEDIRNILSSYDEEAKKKALAKKESTFFESLIMVIASAWSIATIYITLGTTIFDYGKQPILHLHQIHLLLDLRINLIILIAGIIGIKSIVTVAKNKKIEIKSWLNPTERKPSESQNGKSMFIFISGLYAFLNLGIMLVSSLVNFFIKLFGTIALYLYFIGGEIFNSFASLIKKSVSLYLFIFMLIFILAGFHFSNQIAEPLVVYMRSNTYIDSLIPLGWIILFIFIMIISLIAANYFTTVTYDHEAHIFHRDEDLYNGNLSELMQTLPILVFSSLIIGVFLFSLSKIDFLKFGHFKIYGIISGILTTIIFVGFLVFFVDNFRRKGATK